MTGEYIAESQVEVNAPAARVWQALTEPAQVKQYFFDTDLKTDWQVGSPMTFSGTWEDKPYEDLGTVLAFEPSRRLSYSHWSPLSGTPDSPENRHTLDVTLAEHDGRTTVTLTQDNNASEEARDHSADNWRMVLDGLKQHVEGAK